ncbi:MAG: hypothetical protein JO279_17440 [Verrucomicrobia bacterium]|nr:hypothetical protein [Verrucomicrobiota bacterium]
MKTWARSVITEKLFWAFLFVLGLREAPLHAQGAFKTISGSSPSASALSYELDAETSVFGIGSANAGSRNVGNITEISSSASLVLSAQVRDTVLLRLGVEWQRYAFNPEAQAPIPDSVQGLDLAIGADLQVAPALLLRIEAHPGVYSDFADISWQDVNVPFEIAGTYFYSTDLLFIGGVYVDVDADTPVFPVVGIRWKLSDKWLIDGVAPRPQIQYRLTDKATLFAGADLREATFRVGQQFGQTRGIRKLNDAILDYFEIRAGGGLTWKISQNVDVDLEGGCAPYRRFDYPRADGYKVKSEDWVPYLRIALSAKF